MRRGVAWVGLAVGGERWAMGRKGKTQTHTAKEIAAKHAAAKYAAGAAGGGGKLATERKLAGTKVAVFCSICKSVQPNIKSMHAHYDSKHPKEPWATLEAKYDAQFNANRDNLKKADPTFKEKKTEAERLKDKENREKAKLQKMTGGAGAAPVAKEDLKLKALEQEMLPLVKKGDTAQAQGDLDGALALFQEAMDGFRAAGYKRPKLKEKIDAVKELIAAQEAEPAVDQSVEVDASVDAEGAEEC